MVKKMFSDETMHQARRAVQEHRMLPLCNDLVFKMFLTQDTAESRYCLRKILAAIIGRTVRDATVLNPEILPEFLESKMIRLDINVVLENGDKANIEMQCGRNNDDQILRTVFYSGRLISSSLRQGELYSQINSVHQIMIADFTLFGASDKKDTFFHHWMLKDEKNEVGTDHFNIYFLELTKLDRIIREKLASLDAACDLTELEFWCILLKGGSKIIRFLSHL